jgi:hypothetical protein
MPKPIPALPRSSVGTDRRPFDESVKENLEVIAGLRGSRVTQLKPSATLDEVAAKLNEVIALLQGR